MRKMPLGTIVSKFRGAWTYLTKHAAGLWEEESPRVILWVPVSFGLGIAIYFSLPMEPAPAIAITVLAASTALYVDASCTRLGTLMCGAIFIAALGFANAMFRTHMVEAPIIAKKTRIVEVTGWLEHAESRLRGERLRIRVLSIDKFAPKQTPYKVRLQNNVAGGNHKAGDAIQVKAILRPLPEPVEPRGFDFARRAWFLQIGAVGHTIEAPRLLKNAREPPSIPWDLALKAYIERLRYAISTKIRSALPEQAGAIADALITGNRGGIPTALIEDLRQSGLAHILAISGLHMALMAGSLYWLARAGLALWPRAALYFPIRKWSALIALAGGFFYLLLSGASIATIRAFIMIAVVFFALLLDRRALSLRNVALGATIILLRWPEALFDVSFQMSFAAVTALISVHDWQYARMEKRDGAAAPPPSSIGWYITTIARYLRGLATTTLVASMAVAPFAVFHFHKFAAFGLIANLAAMPLVAFLIMPAALLSLIAMPLNLEYAPLMLMGWGVEQVVAVAHYVRGLSGAVSAVPAIPQTSLAAISLGGLWLLIWRSTWRFAGLTGIIFGIILASRHKAPDVFVERDAKTFAIRAPDGSLSAPKRRGGRYSLEQWLRADGDQRPVREVQNGKAYRCDLLGCVAKVKDKQISFVLHPAALEEDCAKGDVVIVTWPLNKRLYRACSKDALIIDRWALMEKGAHALYIHEDGTIKIVTAADIRGHRPWSSKSSKTSKSSKSSKTLKSPRL